MDPVTPTNQPAPDSPSPAPAAPVAPAPTPATPAVPAPTPVPAPATPTPAPEPAVPDEGPLAQPVAPEKPAQPVPEVEKEAPKFRALGQPDVPDGAAEAAWLRQQYAASLQQLAEAQQRVEDLELSGLDEDEREAAKLRKQVEQFQAQQEQIQYEAAMNEWRGYYAQFQPYTGEINLRHVEDPVQMGHQVTTSMATRIAQQQETIATLEAKVQALTGAKEGDPPPPVTQGASDGIAGRKTWRDMTPDERQTANKRIRLGLASVNDYI